MPSTDSSESAEYDDDECGYLHPYYDNHQDERNRDDDDDDSDRSNLSSSSSSYSSWNSDGGSSRRFDDTNDCIAELCADMSRRCLQEAQAQGIRDQNDAGIVLAASTGNDESDSKSETFE